MPAGAPVGNTNASKSRVVEQALKRACVQEDYKRLHTGIQKLLDQVAEGERWALELVRDTLDGKPKQQTEISGPEGGPIQTTTVDLGPSVLGMIEKIRAASEGS